MSLRIRYVIFISRTNIFFRVCGSFSRSTTRFSCNATEARQNALRSSASIVESESTRVAKVLRHSRAAQNAYVAALSAVSASAAVRTSSRNREIHSNVALRALLSRPLTDWRSVPEAKEKSRRLRVMRISMQCVSRQLDTMLRRRLPICSIKR